MSNFLLPPNEARRVAARIAAICTSDSIRAYIRNYEYADAFVVTCALDKAGEVISFASSDGFEELAGKPGQEALLAAWKRRTVLEVTLGILVYLPNGGNVRVGRNIVRPL